jgi:hypothetical protein
MSGMPIAGNRAGDNEQSLSRDDFIERFLTLPIALTEGRR